jgi:hypothetical protein
VSPGRLVAHLPLPTDRRVPPAREDNIHVLAYKAKVRPDGHGIWIEHDRQVSFFVEYDNNTETTLEADRQDRRLRGLGEDVLAGLAGAVLLHSATRERHQYQALSEHGVRYPVATTARDDVEQAGKCPAAHLSWPR